jgi:hypothetical protein
LPPCSTRRTNGFITPGEMPASASICAPAIAVPCREVLQLRLVRVELQPIATSTATIASPTARPATAAQHEARPAAPRAVLGMAVGR